MSTKLKVAFASVVVLVLGIVLLPRLARRIDAAVEPKWNEAAAQEAQYREMAGAYRVASEVLPDHPTRRLYEERRTSLLAAGYIETREIGLPRPLAGRGVVNGFIRSFATNFPGVEMRLRPEAVVVTARKRDFIQIEHFVRGFDSERGR